MRYDYSNRAIHCGWRVVNIVIVILVIGFLSHDRSVVAQVQGGIIEGVIITGKGDAPVERITVWLSHQPDPERTAWAPYRTVKTDEAGRFRFDRVNPGRYTLSIGGDGYITQIYPKREQSGLSSYMKVEEGGVVSGIRIKMERGATISGKVQNKEGRPLDGFTVRLLEPVSAKPIYQSHKTNTRSDGSYQLDGVFPLRYIVRAERLKGKPGETVIESVYYPNAASPVDALPIEVRPGDVLTGIDIIVSEPIPIANAVITGRVVDAATGQPLKNVQIWSAPHSTTTGADGTYRLEVALQGSRSVSAIGEKAGDGYKMDVKQIDLQGNLEVNFTLHRSPLIIATVEYVGSARPPAPGEYSVSVESKCTKCGFHRSLPYRGVSTFELRGLEPVPTRIDVGFTSLKYKVAQIMLGEEDITGRWIELNANTKEKVRILLTDK